MVPSQIPRVRYLLRVALVPRSDNFRNHRNEFLAMNTPTRREKIEAMLADDPDDTFLRYSLAMELEKEARHQESLERLESLTKDETPYVPAFFMAGQQLTRLGRIEEARAFLRDGIEEARRQGDAHAAGEMSEFLTSLGSIG